jgi:hypothetical protein
MFNYKPVYGNYIGVVVDTNDPLSRGRVKVFIPHLSNTLYTEWNADQKDKTFKSFEFSGTLANDIKDVLPWAESSIPIFGGGTSGPVRNIGNGTYQAIPNKSDQITESEAAAQAKALANPSPLFNNRNGDPATANSAAVHNPPTSLDGVPDCVAKFLYGISASETGLSPNGSITNNNIAYVSKESYKNSNNQVGNNSTVRGIYNSNGGNLAAAQAQGGDYGPYQFNADNAKTFGVSYTDSMTNQTVGLANYLAKTDPKTYNSLVDNCNDPTTANQAIMDARYSKFGRLFNAPRDTYNDGQSSFMSAINLDAKTIKSNIGALDSSDKFNQNRENLASGISSDGQSVPNDNSTPVRNWSDVASGFKATPHGGGNYGSPNGVFSRPAVGAKVWVFFYGGDVMRPVYFGAVTEGIGQQVATQSRVGVDYQNNNNTDGKPSASSAGSATAGNADNGANAGGSSTGQPTGEIPTITVRKGANDPKPSDNPNQ